MQEATEHHRALLAHVIAAQEAERARVSRDLHDDVGQALTSVLLGLRFVDDALAEPVIHAEDVRKRLSEVREVVSEALQRTRRLAFDLRPTALDDLGLPAALARLTSTTTERSEVVVDLAITGMVSGERLDRESETVVYRVVQEALTNVVRHSQAVTATVEVSVTSQRVRAVVRDDGIGFDVTAPLECHLGLAGMHERAELLGGEMQIASTPGAGTTVTLELPRV